MRSGDHDARVGVKGAHRKGGERGRVRDGEGQGPTARRRHDARGRTGEIDGAVPGVATDDDARFALGLRLEVGGEARGRTDDDGKVHPGFTRADLATQTRGAEFEGPVHRGPQFGQGTLVTRRSSLDGGEERRRGLTVRIMSGPFASRRKKLIVHRLTPQCPQGSRPSPIRRGARLRPQSWRARSRHRGFRPRP